MQDKSYSGDKYLHKSDFQINRKPSKVLDSYRKMKKHKKYSICIYYKAIDTKWNKTVAGVYIIELKYTITVLVKFFFFFEA